MSNKLTGMAREILAIEADLPYRLNYNTTIKPQPSVDDFDLHIFTQVWGSTSLGFPCLTENIPAWYRRNRHYEFNPDWRNASNKDWEMARWFNGMELAELHSIVERGKQIMCGHWHASFGHSKLEKKCSEFGNDADFSPYYSKNIIAIDACASHSGFVNCIVIEDKD